LQLPFRAAKPEALAAEILGSDPPSASRVDRSIPGDLALVAATAMAREPDHRYQSAHDLAADLERVLRHERIAARASPLVLRARRWTQRHPVATAVVPLLVVALAVTLLLVIELRAALRRTRAIALAAEAQKALGEDANLSVLLARAGLQTEDILET